MNRSKKPLSGNFGDETIAEHYNLQFNELPSERFYRREKNKPSRLTKGGVATSDDIKDRRENEKLIRERRQGEKNRRDAGLDD